MKRGAAKKKFPREFPKEPRLLALSLAAALCLGFIDFLMSLAGRPADLASWRAALDPLGASCAFFFILFWALWGAVHLLVGRLARLEPQALGVSVALFLAVDYLLLRRRDLFHLPPPAAQWGEMAFLSGVALLAAGANYLGFSGIPKDSPAYARGFWRAMTVPVVLGQAALLAWLHEYLLREAPGILKAFFVSAGMLLLLTTIVVGWRAASPKGASLTLLALLVGVVAGAAGDVVVGPAFERVPRGTFQGERRIKHVIFVTVDTLRADALSCYGGREITTPAFDGLARDGILFENAISPSPWTLPSIASLMTGLDTPALNLGFVREPQFAVSREVKTLAEFMRDAGYTTAAVGRNAFLLPASRMDQGFLEYEFFPKSVQAGLGYKILKRLLPYRYRSDAGTEAITQMALRWLAKHRREDFFFWIHYFDPHGPYEPPRPFLEGLEAVPSIGYRFDLFTRIRGGYFVPSAGEQAWIKRLYLAEVRYVDRELAKIVAALKELGIYDQSLLVLTSDHGEELFEHGLIGHGYSLYREMLRVPLLLKLPRSSGVAGTRLETAVAANRVMPTLLDLCGLPYDGEHLSVKSLAPGLAAHGTWAAEPILSAGLMYYEDRAAILFGGKKYIRTVAGAREELYDTIQDPGESKSLAFSEYPALIEGRVLLDGRLAAAEGLRNHYRLRPEKAEWDETTIQNLRALGYVH